MSMTNSAEKIVNENDMESSVLPGTFDDDSVIRGLLADAIREYDKSREQIAERMSWLLSKAITADMLNNFTADSKLNHRFPLAWCRAFCKSTDDWRLIQYVAEQSDFTLMRREDSDVFTLGELVIQREQTDREISRHASNIIERRAR